MPTTKFNINKTHANYYYYMVFLLTSANLGRPQITVHNKHCWACDHYLASILAKLCKQ